MGALVGWEDFVVVLHPLRTRKDHGTKSHNEMRRTMIVILRIRHGARPAISFIGVPPRLFAFFLLPFAFSAHTLTQTAGRY
jgi:hypothetical protein